MSHTTPRPSRRMGAIAAAIVALALVATPLPPVGAQTRSSGLPFGDIRLDPDKQKRIWDLEHATFLIETYFGKPWVAALAQGKRERVAAAFREGFRGAVLDLAAGQRRSRAGVTEIRFDRPGSEAGGAPADSVSNRLLDVVAGFSRIDKTKFQLTRIDFGTPAGEAWVAEALLQVVGASTDGSPREHSAMLGMEFRFAGDEAIKSEIRVVERMDFVSETLRTAEQPLLEEVTERVGLADVPLPDNWQLPAEMSRTHRYQFAVEDYDRDGFPDIAIAAINGRPLLLRSVRGARFDDVTSAVGLRPSDDSPVERMLNALVGWIDYDNDGYPDLLMGYRLYHNDAGKRFVDVTDRAGLYFDRSPFGCVVVDYDADGRLDLYIVNQKGFRPRRPGPRPWVGDTDAGTENHLWRNEGGGKFTNVTAKANAAGGRHQTFAGAALFLDDDASPDLYLANDFGANVLLRNRGDGTFEDVTDRTGTGDFSTSMGVAAGDLNNDGRSELYVANMFSKMGRRIIAHVGEGDYPPGLYPMIRGSLAGNRLYRPTGEGFRFEEFSEDVGVNQVGWAFAPAMVDLDGDGWLDMYATTGFVSKDRAKPDG